MLKFFLNGTTTSHLRGLAEEFNESTNGIRLELNRLQEAGMLKSKRDGNKRIYQANKRHPMFNEIHNIVRKHVGIDQIILNVIDRLGNLERAYISGPLVCGKNSEMIDIVFIGSLEVPYLHQLIEKAEKIISKRIRYIHYTSDQWNDRLQETFDRDPLMIWEKNTEVA